MTYKFSKALEAFDADIEPIMTRLNVLKDKQTEIGEYVNDILFTSIFLSHAYFENYIDDLFCCYTKSFINYKMIDLPASLKAFYFYKAIPDKVHKLAVGFESEDSTLNDLIDCLSSSNKLLNLHQELPDYALKGSFLYETKKYPSVDNLKILFKRIGIKKIFDEISKVLKSDAKAHLESLSSLRTTLAHNGELVGVSFDDVIIRLSKFIKFIKALDRVFYNHLCSEMNEEFWCIEIAA
jgi:hypothetical protein